MILSDKYKDRNKYHKTGKTKNFFKSGLNQGQLQTIISQQPEGVRSSFGAHFKDQKQEKTLQPSVGINHIRQGTNLEENKTNNKEVVKTKKI